MKNKLYLLIITFIMVLILAPQMAFSACEQDLDADGDVDILDLAIFANGLLDESALFAVDFGSVCEYPNAPLLVSADYLEKMNGLIPNLVIIDARSTGYDVAHIPGAISLKWTDFGAPDLNPVAEMEQMLTDKGIKQDFIFVVYDDTTASWGAAGRIFWTLEYLGCHDVSILNGGWDKWVADNRTTETAVNTLPALVQGETFVADINADILATTEHVKNRRLDEDFAIIDSRKDEEYIGWTLYDEARGGHIPGAVQIPYEWFYNPDKTLRTHDDLINLFESRNITTEKEVTAYCTAGIRSGFVYFALRLMGYENCSNYDASIYGWAAGDPLDYPMDKMKNHDKLVYAAWVDELIDGDDEYPPTYPGNGYVIVHASSLYWKGAANPEGYDQEEDYNSGHIPGAISIPLHTFDILVEGGIYPWTEPDDGNILPADQLEEVIESYGITYDKTVIVYCGDKSYLGGAYRVAWALMYAGVEDVRYLNGDLAAWKDNGGTLETTFNTPTPVADFGVTVPVHPEYLVTTSEVQTMIDDPNAVIADDRSWTEYIAEDESACIYDFFCVPGRIPGAVWVHNMYWYTDDIYTGNIPGYYKPASLRSFTEVLNEWNSLNITFEKRIAFYCGGGWRSSLVWFYAYLMGYENAGNYEGGWYEWTWDENNPIELGE